MRKLFQCLAALLALNLAVSTAAADDQLNIPDKAWEQFPEGVAFAMTVTASAGKDGAAGAVHFYVKNISKADKTMLENRLFPLFGIFYLDDHGSQVLLREIDRYEARQPIVSLTRSTTVIIKPGEILSRSLDLDPNDLALLKTHKVICGFSVGDPATKKMTPLESAPKILAITP